MAPWLKERWEARAAAAKAHGDAAPPKAQNAACWDPCAADPGTGLPVVMTDEMRWKALAQIHKGGAPAGAQMPQILPLVSQVLIWCRWDGLLL
jgi:hypothetical protein